MSSSGSSPDMAQFFREVKTIAVPGYSDKPERAGHYVSQYLYRQGYKIIAVNPKFGESVDGLPNYASLADIPAGTPVDVIDVFRAPQYAMELVDQAAAMQPPPRYIVFQPGAENAEASERARELGMVPIDACLLAEHRGL